MSDGRSVVRLTERDNVLVAMRPLGCGAEADGVAVREEIPAGHKLAARPIRAGEAVVKFGHIIGAATRDIDAGEHVHTHNVRSVLEGDIGRERADAPRTAGTNENAARDTTGGPIFEGFRRPDGRVGIRNEIWIVNTVGCVNNAAERIATAAAQELVAAGSAIEGVHAFSHQYGCSQLGRDLEATQAILAGLIDHPNAAAVLVLGLGCENNQMKLLLDRAGPQAPERMQFFNAQDVPDEIEEGLRRVRVLARHAEAFRRAPISAAELVVGTKCGGSDGFSGLTANPLVGRVADRLTALGGSVLLTEVPEMFGAEDVLLARARDADVAGRTIDMVNAFRDYFRRHGEAIDENPAPGNKAGGITTLAEKSLGCVQKGGAAPVADVLAYGARARSGLGGLALVNAPGNDGVSSTALVAAGAHLLLFTTGRGTPLGFPAPTIKISSNSELAERKPAWIDFDAGPIARGASTFEELGERLFSFVLDVASGRRLTRNELNGFREIAIWKDGVTL
jgi:altronate hydrolase